MEATLAGLSIGALIFGVVKSRQYSDSTSVTTVIPPTFQTALTTYQSNPTKENLKTLEQLKLQEQNELEKIKRQAQEDGNRRIAQIMEEAKAQAQRMYAQGKLEEAKNIERLAQLKRNTIQEDTQSNLQELAKRFQNTMTTINTMMTNARLTTASDKTLEQQIGVVSNELRTARNNEAILRQQIGQLQTQLKNVSAANPQQIQEMKSALDRAKQCSYESDMLKRELSILKSASSGNQEAIRATGQLLELKRLLDEARRNEQQLQNQLQNERMVKTANTNASSKYRIQQLENQIASLSQSSRGNTSKDYVIANLQNELATVRRGLAGDTNKDYTITNLRNELENAQRREREAVQQLMQARSSSENVKRLQFEANAAKQRASELDNRLSSISSNANSKVMQMADEISKLKFMLQSAKDDYDRLKADRNASLSNTRLSNAKNEIRQWQRKIDNFNVASNSSKDDMRYALRIAELENELLRAKTNLRQTDNLEQQLATMKSKGSEHSQQLALIVSDLTQKLEQAKANEAEAKSALIAAKSSRVDSDMLKLQLEQAQKEAQELRKEMDTLKSAASMASTNVEQANEIAELKKELQLLRSNTIDSNASLVNARRAQEEVKRLSQQVEELEQYKTQVMELRLKLQQQQTSTSVTTNEEFERQGQEIINKALQQAEEIRQQAQNEAAQLVSRINSKVINASVNANATTLRQQLEVAKKNAQSIESTASERYKNLMEETQRLRIELDTLRNQKQTLTNQIDRIPDFPNANNARRQINDTMSSITSELQQQLKNSEQGNASLDDCLQKVGLALREAKVDMSKIQTFVVNARANDPNLHTEIEKLQKAIELKNTALLEAQRLQAEAEIRTSALEKKLKDNPNVELTIVNKLESQTNEIIDKAKIEVKELLDTQFVCPVNTCPVQTELTCDALPSTKIDFSTDVYETVYNALRRTKADLYSKSDDITSMLDTMTRKVKVLENPPRPQNSQKPQKPPQVTTTNEYLKPLMDVKTSSSQSPINADKILTTHNNVFIPLVNLEYVPSNAAIATGTADTTSKLLRDCKDGINDVLLTLKTFLRSESLNTQYLSLIHI
jgi:hypothetical protein